MRMKKFYSLLVLMFACASLHAQSWLGGIPEEGAYNNYTVVVAQLMTSNITSTDLVIGAFMEDKCRVSVGPDKDLSGAPKLSISGNPIYTIVVPGDLNTVTTDAGKLISFKVYDPSTGLEYSLTPTVTFDGETHGFPPSDPGILFTLTAPTSYSMTFTEAEVGKTYDLNTLLTVAPAGASVPENLTWTVSIGDPTTWTDPSQYVSLNGSQLQALAPYKGVALNAYDANNASIFTAPCYFDIVKHATSIVLQQTSLKAVKNTSMKELMAASYKVEPTDATDEVLWEKIDDNNILTWDNTEGCYVPVAGGTAKIRPYITLSTGKLVPANDGWITVTVEVPVTEIQVDYTLFNEDPTAIASYFKANVGDKNLYQRLQRLITVLPADATDKSYTISMETSTAVVLVGATSLQAQNEGLATVKVTANNGVNPTSGAPVTANVNIQVVKPTTAANVQQSTLYVPCTDTDLPKDITADVQGFVTFNGTNPVGTVTLSGSSVTCPAPGLDATAGLSGTYTAVAKGTTTVTINLQWPNYDEWGINSDVLTYSSFQKQFDIIVQEALSAFNVAVTNAVVGGNGTITLTPQPAGAAFDIADIGVTIDNGYTGDWGAQLVVTKGSQTTAALVFNYTSAIPGVVNISVTRKDPTATAGDIPVNLYDDSTTPTTNYSFEIGWPLSLASGWQWRSNPCGAVPVADLLTKYSNDLVEIRTNNKLLFNDPSWGLYGTLTSTAGLLQGQCYKVNMTNAYESTLFGSSAADPSLKAGTYNADGSVSVTLKAGWNWVGNPYLFDRVLNSLFSGAASGILDGTIIIGKTGSAEYKAASGLWEGDLKVLKAGEGYVISNPGTTDFNLVFPAETSMIPAHESAPAGVKGMGGSVKVWEYDHTRFMNNMTMVATLADIEHPDQYSIGAFVGDECRGEGFVENGKAFITVHCNVGEFVTFKLYSPYTNDFYPIEEGLQAQTRIGSLNAPFRLHAAGVVDGIDAVASPTGDANTALDLNGRRTIANQRGITVRRMSDGSVRKVIVK